MIHNITMVIDKIPTKAIVCKHCKKQINSKAKIIGLTVICPYCKKPSEEVLKKSINARSK